MKKFQAFLGEAEWVRRVRVAQEVAQRGEDAPVYWQVVKDNVTYITKGEMAPAHEVSEANLMEA